MMVFISCNLELEAFMEYHMVLVYTGNQLQLREDTDLGVLGFVLLGFFKKQRLLQRKTLQTSTSAVWGLHSEKLSMIIYEQAVYFCYMIIT